MIKNIFIPLKTDLESPEHRLQDGMYTWCTVQQLVVLTSLLRILPQQRRQPKEA